MKKYTLTAYQSRADIYGNRYYYFKFTDNETGKQVAGRVSGSDSNIYSIIYNWDVSQGWSNSDIFDYNFIKNIPIREFNRFNKDLKYAGCNGVDLVKFIKESLYQ